MLYFDQFQYYKQKGALIMNTITLNCQRLIQCRKKMGITKQEAAKRMNMSQPAYLRYESGTRTPSIHVINSMANVLNTSADYLIGTTDDPHPDSYLINKDTDPELFTLIEDYRSDPNVKKRLETYYKSISSIYANNPKEL